MIKSIDDTSNDWQDFLQGDLYHLTTFGKLYHTYTTLAMATEYFFGKTIALALTPSMLNFHVYTTSPLDIMNPLSHFL